MKKTCAATLAVLLCFLLIASCGKKATPAPVPLEEAGSISVGDHVLFGNYPQIRPLTERQMSTATGILILKRMRTALTVIMFLPRTTASGLSS